MTNLTGELSISKVTNLSEPRNHYVSITLYDQNSATKVLEARMSLETFAKALFSSQVSVEFDLHQDHIGKKYEVKTIKVSIPDNWTTEQAETFLRTYEVDSWICRISDLRNHHNRIGKDTYSISFYRWI